MVELVLVNHQQLSQLEEVEEQVELEQLLVVTQVGKLELDLMLILKLVELMELQDP
jgi:hypothetical protein